MTNRETCIAEIVAEFSDIFAFARTRWVRDAAEVHDELRGVGLMVLQTVKRKGPISSTDLGQLLDMDKAMVSRQVAKLRDLGCIVAEASPGDRRVSLLTASEEGANLLRRVRERSVEAYRERFAEWSEEDLARLYGDLHRFNSPEGDSANSPLATPDPHHR